MTNIVALVRAWLVSDFVVSDLVDDRVSSILDPEDGFPAIGIGSVTGGPRSTTTAGVDTVEDWSVALYCYGGRLNGNDSDLPDNQAAWEVVTAISYAAQNIATEHFIDDGAAIVAAQVVTSSATAVDPDTGSSRATVTLSLQVWR